MSTPVTATQDSLRSRLPDPNLFVPDFAEIAGAMFKAISNGSVPPATVSLVQLRAAQIIGNTYHTVRATSSLRQAGESEERITAVASWRDAPYFTDPERVALELVDAVLTPNPFGERVPEELCARASALYDHKGLWTLTMAISQMCFFIPVALIGKPIAGQEPHWTK
jgi:alkylhydroperoxidase family enzyme